MNWLMAMAIPVIGIEVEPMELHGTMPYYKVKVYFADPKDGGSITTATSTMSAKELWQYAQQKAGVL